MAASDLPQVIQFPHRGKEHGPDRGKTCRHWTRDDELHGRKFLVAAGERIDGSDNRVVDADLRFWGEWEPPSKVQPCDGLRDVEPRSLHSPYLPREPPPRRHNTDPFVFGERGFLYTVCYQWRGVAPSWMQRLVRGSIILFGSAHYSPDRFVLDTVLVVDGIRQHDHANYGQLGPFVPPEYFKVTLDPVYGGPGTGRPLSGGPYTLYTGATSDNAVDGMYSFFPCRSGTHAQPCFPRPEITVPELLPLAQSPRVIPTADAAAVRSAWVLVVEQVRNQGCDLGIVAAVPSIDCSPCD